MVIKATLIEINEPTQEYETGAYFRIETSQGEEVFIHADEFEKLYLQSQDTQNTEEQGIGVNTGTTLISPPRTERPDFTVVLQEVLKKTNCTLKENKLHLDKVKELSIQSDQDKFLELDWEHVVQDDVVIYREVLNSVTVDDRGEGANNFLIATSYSHGEKIPIKGGINSEVREITAAIIEGNDPRFKTYSITNIKHLTKEMVGEMKWEKYNYLHIIMHGEENGDLCLEDATTSTIIDHLSAADLIDSMTGRAGTHFQLCFLSYCYSAGSMSLPGGVSLLLVKRGVCDFAIGFPYKIGEDSARNFAEEVYGLIVKGTNIKDAFKVAYLNHRKRRKDNKYIPVMYIRNSAN